MLTAVVRQVQSLFCSDIDEGRALRILNDDIYRRTQRNAAYLLPSLARIARNQDASGSCSDQNYRRILTADRNASRARVKAATISDSVPSLRGIASPIQPRVRRGEDFRTSGAV